MGSGWRGRRTSTQALQVIPSIRSSHVSEGPFVSGSPSAWGSSTEPPPGDLLSKFVRMLDSVDIIALGGVGEMVRKLEGRAGGIGVGQPTQGRRIGGVAWGSTKSYCSARLISNREPTTAINGLGTNFQIRKQRPPPSSFPPRGRRRKTEMGRLRRSRTHKAQRDTHRASRTRARTKDLDQIQLIDMDPKVHSSISHT